MTPPRQVIPGQFHFITRRVAQRQFLLRPSQNTREVLVYCMAVAARRYGVKVCWLMVMSNHYHAGVHDVHGRFPEFLRYFHSLVARCLNSHHGRWENLWASEPTSVVRLGDADAIFDKMIYSLCNAVTADLVDRVHNWPGFCSYGYQIDDRPAVARRPHWFFREEGPLPAREELHFERPPEFEKLSIEDWVNKIRSAVADHEASSAEKRMAEGRRVVGRKAIRRQSPFSSPRTWDQRRGISPRVATKNKWRRIELLTQNKLFQRRYREAHKRRSAGDVDVLFPYGSYKLSVQGLVRCEPPPLH
jgi:REP element-mobilizing transposase RayT